MYRVDVHYRGFPLVSFWFKDLVWAEARVADAMACGALSAALHTEA